MQWQRCFFPIFLFRGVLLDGWLRCKRMGLKNGFLLPAGIGEVQIGSQVRWDGLLDEVQSPLGIGEKKTRSVESKKKTDGTDRSCYTAVLIFLSLSVLVCRTTFITFIISSRSTTFRVLSIRDFV